jgi:hypothetical protein
MHVEGRRIGTQQVIVHGSELDAVLDHLCHDGVDLAFKQYEIAHDHCVTMHRFERYPAAERQGGLNGDAVQRHVEVRARETVAVRIT